VPVELNISRMPGAGPPMFTGFVRDISERTKAERALRAVEERFGLFMEHLPAAAFIKDAQGYYVYGNTAWRKQFPDGLSDFTGKTDSMIWPPDTAAVFAASDQKVLIEGNPIQLIETGMVGGEPRHWVVSKFLIKGLGEMPLIGGLAFDTTESKRLEEQLHQAQRLEAIGLLAGGVAHDFNNLLTVILGYADSALYGLSEQDRLYAGLEEIRKAAQKAATLTAQLLAFGRKQVLQPRILDLNETIKEMQGIFRRLVREDISVNLSLGEIGMVKADPVQIQQVIINLVANARDAMPDGGRILIETGNVERDEAFMVSHRAMQPGAYVMIAVTDTGIGIDAVTQVHMFEPFFTTKEMGKGTGLGLATVYGIVKQSGGYIWVYSEPGQGATFKVYFPRADDVYPTDEAAETVSTPERDDNADRTILVAEDEETVRRLVVQACIDAGYTVLEARNGVEALEVAESNDGRIDLLITDLIMPGMNGRVLASQIARNRPETKVLYCSGYAEGMLTESGSPQLPIRFLQKPFTPRKLVETIRTLMKG
jgi:two-component system cell cycle sensor histidine kinase/response regulator CckA